MYIGSMLCSFSKNSGSQWFSTLKYFHEKRIIPSRETACLFETSARETKKIPLLADMLHTGKFCTSMRARKKSCAITSLA
eukprot:UN24232